MKDNLFEMLLLLFEKSLSQLQKNQQDEINPSPTGDGKVETSEEGDDFLYLQSPQKTSTRVFTCDERVRLTKASYQFLMRMKLWNIIDEESFEATMNQIDCSDSHIVNLYETKWTLRNVLSSKLTENQLTFLDSILFQEESAVLH